MLHLLLKNVKTEWVNKLRRLWEEKKKQHKKCLIVKNGSIFTAAFICTSAAVFCCFVLFLNKHVML